MVRTYSFLFPCLCACVLSCATSGEDPFSSMEGVNVGGAPYLPAGGSGPSAGAAGVPMMENGGGRSGAPPTNPPPGAGGSMNMGSGGAAPSGSGGFVASAGGASPGTGGVSLGTGGMSIGAGGSMNPGMGGMNAGSGGAMVGGNSGKCTFTFDVTTVTANGRYAPRNAGAIWISDAQDKFVKTLKTWSILEMAQVTAWVKASNNNRTDAVTGATRSGHGPVNATWNCTDVQKNAVPDGQYVAHVTFAESDAPLFGGGTPIQASVNFTKSAAGDDVMGTDTANFKMMHVKLTVP